MHAYILVQQDLTNYEEVANKIARKHKAKSLPFLLQKIDDVRNLRKLTKLSLPQKTAIFIKNIDKATTEAQNAFLKSLEEPQDNLIYILTASSISNILETVQSRCEIIKVKNKRTPEEQNYSKAKKFKNSKIDDKFEIFAAIKDRLEAIQFLENLIFFDYQEKDFSDMEIYLKTLKNLKNNGNVSLQLTNMLVSSIG